MTIMNLNAVPIFLITAMVVVSCNSKKEEEVEMLNKKLGELKKESTMLREESSASRAKLKEMSNYAARINQNKELLAKAKRDIEPLQAYVGQLNQGVEHYSAINQAWQQAYRESLVGMKASSMKKTDGTSIPNIEIKEVRDEEVVLMSNGSELTVSISDLAKPVRMRLVHEETVKLEVTQ